MTQRHFYLRGFADAKPSEAIQPHHLPGLAVAVVFPGKTGTDILEIPVKQYKDCKQRTKGNVARRLATWLRNQSSEGLQLTGFFLVADQVAAANCGLSLLEELPSTRVERHFKSYRLFFGNDHIDIAQAVALEYYEAVINFGALRACLSVPPQFRTLFVAMDRFPGQSPEDAIPGNSVESTPGARFLNFVREHSSTGQYIRRENESIGLTAVHGTLDWWKPTEGEEWQKGKTHPHFVLPDWLAAAALAESYPEEFAGDFDNSRLGSDAVDGLRDLYEAFKGFDIWSMTGVEFIKGAVQNWSVPDDVRTFILDRAAKR
jgi:hypothetical protein